jgi:hypothetical protein
MICLRQALEIYPGRTEIAKEALVAAR